MENSKKIIEALKKIDPDKLAEEFLKEEAVRLQSLQTFFHGLRFREIINLLKTEIGEDGGMGDNPYVDFLFSNVTNEEFIKIFEVVYHPEILNLPVQEEKGMFPVESVTYEGLKFLQIHGQGTAFIVQGPKFKQRDTK